METTAKMTQQEEILQYLKDHGSITRLQAACDLHIFELSSRIGELTKKGYNITSTRAFGVNKNGRVSHFSVYRLEE
jgi:hypothetical protein